MVKYDSQKIDYQLHIDSEYYNTLDIEDNMKTIRVVAAIIRSSICPWIALFAG
ncbi:MAG: hypothetical protein IJ468_13890 [Lachnospiraceae bacterium]|nr:hypothetical protein [Lachnospiraceae bacterium]